MTAAGVELISTFVKKFTRRFVRRSARAHLRKGLTHQQVYDTLAGELGFRGTADMRMLNRLAGWIEQVPGFAALKKERWRRALLMGMLIFLAGAEAVGAFPVILMLGIHELSTELLVPAAVFLFIYPAIYAILAILSAGRSMYLYRWIMAIMFIALLKDLPAFSIYFNAEKLMFGLIVAVKFVSLLLAMLIYRGLKSHISVDITPDQPTSTNSHTAVDTVETDLKPGDQ